MSDISGNIRLKRVYDPPEDRDGRRILATRYWPRGVARSSVDEYISRLAPSRDLIKVYQKDSQIDWNEFSRRYGEELEGEEARGELRRLARLAQSQVITLLCFCAEERGCHRTLLRRAIIDANSVTVSAT